MVKPKMNIRPAPQLREYRDEFFIGYAPPMPPRLARFVTRIVVGLACGVLAWAVTVAAGHVRLEGGTFAFGHPQRFAGTVVERPYPALRPDGVEPNRAWLLLVAPDAEPALYEAVAAASEPWFRSLAAFYDVFDEYLPGHPVVARWRARWEPRL